MLHEAVPPLRSTPYWDRVTPFAETVNVSCWLCWFIPSPFSLGFVCRGAGNLNQFEIVIHASPSLIPPAPFAFPIALQPAVIHGPGRNGKFIGPVFFSPFSGFFSCYAKQPNFFKVAFLSNSLGQLLSPPHRLTGFLSDGCRDGFSLGK